MFIRWNVPKSKTKGETIPYVCPRCKANSRFLLVERKLQLSINFVPIASSDFVYEAICPGCSCVFEFTKETFRSERTKGSNWQPEANVSVRQLPVKKLGPESARGLSAEEEIGRVAKIALDLISTNKSWVGACDANLRGWARGAANTYPTVAPELFYNSVMEMVSEKVSEKVFRNETVPTWRKARKQDGAGGNGAKTPNPFL